MKVRCFFKTFFIVILIWPLISCNSGKEVTDGNNILQYSSLLKIFELDGYEEAVVSNAKGNIIAKYILVEKDKSVPDSILTDAIEIKVPLERIITDSEVYASAFEELGAADVLYGMFDGAYATSPEIRTKLESNEIADVGSPAAPDIEKIVELCPEAMLISYYDGMQAQGLENRGIPIIKMVDLQEETPLGRAEWLKFLGRLIGKGELADSIANSVANNYEEIIAESYDNAGEGPIVLTDLMYEGTWYVPGGKSYQANLIEDSGAEYFKQNDEHTVTLNLTPEQVLTEGGDADLWIIRHFGSEDDLRTIMKADPIYQEIKAYSEGNVYYSDTSKSGLFREFPFHPDRLLRDYRRMAEGGNDAVDLRYFKKLETK